MPLHHEAGVIYIVYYDSRFANRKSYCFCNIYFFQIFLVETARTRSLILRRLVGTPDLQHGNKVFAVYTIVSLGASTESRGVQNYLNHISQKLLIIASSVFYCSLALEMGYQRQKSLCASSQWSPIFRQSNKSHMP